MVWETKVEVYRKRHKQIHRGKKNISMVIKTLFQMRLGHTEVETNYSWHFWYKSLFQYRCLWPPILNLYRKIFCVKLDVVIRWIPFTVDVFEWWLPFSSLRKRDSTPFFPFIKTRVVKISYNMTSRFTFVIPFRFFIFFMSNFLFLF